MGGAYFWTRNDSGEDVQIYYSGVSDGRIIGDNDLIGFDYLPGDQVDLTVSRRDVDEEVWDMLLQVLDLNAS